jgi:hypothetical protein
VPSFFVIPNRKKAQQGGALGLSADLTAKHRRKGRNAQGAVLLGNTWRTPLQGVSFSVAKATSP